MYFWILLLSASVMENPLNSGFKQNLLGIWTPYCQAASRETAKTS